MQSLVWSYLALKQSGHEAMALTLLAINVSSLVLHVAKVPWNAADDGYTK
jgi:hypothetical protein